MHKRLFIFILALTAFFWYCGDDDSGTGPSSSEEPPEFNVEFPTLPQKMQQSNNINAQQINGYLTTAQLLSSSYMPFLSPPGNAGVGDWEYTWSDGDLTVHLKITESDNKLHWKVYFTGTNQGETYDNWLAMEAERNKAATALSFIIYEKDMQGPQATFDYEEKNTGTLAYDFKSYSPGNTMRVYAEINQNSSGWAERYDEIDGEFVRAKKYEWDANGNGQWWEYGNDGTSITSSGSW